MKQKALVFDVSGTDGETPRQKILHKDLAAASVDSSTWDGRTIEMDPTVPLLVLAHVTDLKKEQEALLTLAAESGAHVVLYSGGSVDESNASVGSGRVSRLELSTVRRSLAQMRAGSPSFARALEVVRRRHVVAALAIASWCVGFGSGRSDIAQQQQTWTTDRRKWLEMLEGETREELLAAMGADDLEILRRRSPSIGGLLEWLWPAGKQPAAPDFAAVTRELLDSYAVKV